ncbi:PORIN/VOLTAGE-DEPENDENT ANION-SELECTIVE CHANNEL PROTEIN [Salix purpurea]|uniref:PORIN/VOLTAGE-DEPENDENT ANION-SELECTIVE CHANNEL PROTEIN n=1 Tax=Salix purpurea TaxID=77065 RepID=A0A9Q0VHZ3_SALPP|nr:PORIN/VOLTAGE-DEPENDENT ANION-SELECTIVE CHANNEL PROTEIN [Salix purpurea]
MKESLIVNQQMGRFPGLYFDIGKKARDVLYKDYAKQPPTYFHYHCFKWNFDLSCETQEILPGLTTVFRFVIPDSSNVEVRFMQNYFGIASGVGVKAYQQGSFKGNGYNPIVNFSGVIGRTLFSLGTDISFDISTKTFDQFTAGLSFNGPFLIASLTLDDKFDTLKASCYRELNPLTRTAIAAELKHSPLLNGSTTLTIGAQHALFPFTLIKARANTEGKINTLIRMELWEKVLVSMNGEVDCWATNKISKIGLSVALRA